MTPSPDKFVDASSCRFDRSSYRRELAVQYEYHIVGQPTLAERSKAPDVHKHDRNLALAPLRDVDAGPGVQ